MTSRSALLVLSLAAGWLLGFDDTSPEWEAHVGSQVVKFLGEGQADGVSIAIARGGEVVYREGFGYVDAKRGLVADTESSFPVGSLLEQLATVAMFQLADSEKLDLDTPLVEVLPGLKLEWETVRLRHLIEGTSGIPDFTDFAKASGPEVEVAHVLEFLASAALETEPGTCYASSNSNLLLAVLVIEKVSGKSIGDFLEEELFGPAEMSATSWCDEDSPARDAPVVVLEDGSQVDVRAVLPSEYGEARMCSNVEDLLRFRASLDSGVLLSARALELLTSTVRLENGETTDRAYGMDLSLLEDMRCESFGGGIGGARMHVARFPDADMTFVLLAMGAEGSLRPLARRIARNVFGLAPLEVTDLPLDSEQRSVFIGGYYVGCDRYAVRESGERLELVPPMSESYLLRYQGHQRFLAMDDDDISLIFELNSEGDAILFRLIYHGIETRAVRRE